MKKVFLAFGVCVLALLSMSSALADFDITHWQYRTKIFSSLTSPAYVTLELTPEIFSHLKNDLSDLRIGTGGSEVPYVVAQERETENYQPLHAKVYDLSSKSGVSTSFIVDLGQSGAFHNSITIDAVAENFRWIVEVQGSDDKKNWRTLNPRGQIYDYTVRDIKPVAVRDTTVMYPNSTVRYLRATIFDQRDSLLYVSGVRVFRHLATPAREVSFTPGIEISQNANEKSTDVILDLGARGIPHRRAVFTTSSTNFHRAVAVYDSDNKQDWQLLTHGYLFSIDTAKFKGNNLAVSYPESNHRYVRFSILNGDDVPILVGNVNLYGVIRSVLFRYEPGREYYIYAGTSDAKRPQYDIEKISQYVDAFDRATTGPIEENPQYKPTEPPKPPFTERSPYVLPLLLGVVVAILAFLLLRTVAKTRMPPPAV